jgi:hypothetical protein
VGWGAGSSVGWGAGSTVAWGKMAVGSAVDPIPTLQARPALKNISHPIIIDKRRIIFLLN